MHKIKYILLIALSILFVLPFSVVAEEVETTDEALDIRVPLYLFRGEGCPHCQEAEEWLESLGEEYTSKLKVVDYEVWYDTDNQELMEKVAKVRNQEEEVTGVPYIIVGDQSWIGFDASYEEEILNKVNSMYEQDVADRYDVMDFVDTSKSSKEKGKSNDLVIILVALVFGGAIGYGVFAARKNVEE